MSLPKDPDTIMKTVEEMAPDPLLNLMHVESMNVAGLETLQRDLVNLPNGLYRKNSRQPKNKGQVHVGWTTMSGPQTQAVCGEQMPYLSVPYKYLFEKKPIASVCKKIQPQIGADR